MAMNEKEYMDALQKMPGSRQNDIIRAVNCKVPKKDAGLKTEVEEMFYDRLWKEADALEKRGGVRPIFDTVEIETDDPRLDIYSKE